MSNVQRVTRVQNRRRLLAATATRPSPAPAESNRSGNPTPSYNTTQLAERKAREHACPVASGEPDRSEYDEWGRHKDYVAPVESDDGLGGSIQSSEYEGSESDDEMPADNSLGEDKGCRQSDRPALTEAALKAHHRVYEQQLRELNKNIANVFNNGLNQSIDGSTDDETTAAVRAMPQEEWIKHRDAGLRRRPPPKPARIKRLMDAGAAKSQIEDLAQSLTETIFHLKFDIPWTFVAYLNGIAAVREQPGKTMLMTYMDDRVSHISKQEDIVEEIDEAIEATAVATFRQGFTPRNHILALLKKQIPGEHTMSDVKEIVQQFNIVDIGEATIIAMLEALCVQSSVHDAAIRTLTKDLRKRKRREEELEQRIVAQKQELLAHIDEKNREHRAHIDEKDRDHRAYLDQKLGELMKLFKGEAAPDEGDAGPTAYLSQGKAKKTIPSRDACSAALRLLFVVGSTAQCELSTAEIQTILKTHGYAFSCITVGQALGHLAAGKRHVKSGALYRVQERQQD